MGNWWGAIHFKTTDRDLVRKALSDVAAKRELKCLLGPEINGWVSVYPQDNGQDTSVAEAIASATKLDAFHLLLCDDDVFAYNFFHGGKLEDEYTSKPGYFTNADFAAEEKMVGRPELYEHLLLKPIELAKKTLKRVPPGESGAFDSSAQFEEFAALLGIENAATSYEYLDQGEREGIQRWKEFERFPNPKLEKNARKREIDQLIESGSLLAAYPGKKNCAAHWSLDPLRNGFLLSWMKVLEFTRTAIHRLHAPWPKKPELLDIPIDGAVIELSASGRGNTFALSIQSASNFRCELWNLESVQKVRDLPDSTWLNFSPDGQLLCLISPDQVQVADVATGETLRIVKAYKCRGAIVNPTNELLLINYASGLLLVDLASDAPARAIYPGGISQQSKEIARRVPRVFDAVAYAATMRKNMAAGIGELRKVLQRKAGKKIDSLDEDALRQLAERHEKTIASTVERAREEHEHAFDLRANEGVAFFQFSADGRLLFCGTHLGLRVYDALEILNGDGELNSTRFAFTPPTDEVPARHVSNYVHAFVEDSRRNRLIFGSTNGIIRTMDLSTGKVAMLFTVPEQGWITQLKVTPDGSALGCLSDASLLNPQNPDPQLFYVWKLS
jgi:WD40 repeat protein